MLVYSSSISSIKTTKQSRQCSSSRLILKTTSFKELLKNTLWNNSFHFLLMRTNKTTTKWIKIVHIMSLGIAFQSSWIVNRIKWTVQKHNQKKRDYNSKNQQKTTRIIKDFKMYYNFEYCAPLLLHHWKHYSRPMSLVLILYTSMLMVCPNSSGTQSFNTHLLTGASLSISRLSYCRSRPSQWFYHFHTHIHLLILI